MRTVAIGLILLALACGPALTCPPAADASGITCGGIGKDVRVSDRHDPDDARLAISTERDEVTLLLTDREVVLQLSDRTMRKVRRELREARDEQDNALASAIATVVTNAVGELLDHSFICRIRDLREATYEDGHLVLIGRHGTVVFGNDNGCDPDGLEGFSEKDALKFVSEFRRVKEGT